MSDVLTDQISFTDEEVAPTPEEDVVVPEVEAFDPEPEFEAEEPIADKEPVKNSDDDVINALESRLEPVAVTLSYGGQERTYVQKPLTYFRKMEFFGLLGETLDLAMEGEDGLSVNAIFGGEEGNLLSAFNDIDSFLALVAKVAHYVPSFLKEAYVIILNVPKVDRAWAREALDEIDDDAGLEIAERFIDQNWESIRRFFGERVQRLMAKVQQKD